MKPSNLDAIENQVANSSEKNRNFFTTTLVVFVYIAIVVLQTSDLDLLLGRSIKLPIVNIDMPMFAFYISAPFLVLALHFNLLQNIENHYAKLCDWRNASTNQLIPRSNIYPFIFDFAMLDESSVLINITRLVNQIVIFWSGPITLLLILWRFTDYQSLNVTLWHFICLFANLWLVSRCRQVIFGSNSEKILKTQLKHLSHWTKLICFTKNKFNYFLCVFTWCIKGTFKQSVSNAIGMIVWLSSIMQLLMLLIIKMPYDQIVLGTPYEYILHIQELPEFFIPRINIDPNINLLELDKDSLRFQYELGEETKSSDAKDSVINSNKESSTAFHNWFMQNGKGLDLRERSFKYANFLHADLRRAVLSKADFEGANLTFAQMQGAWLDQTNFQGASLDGAKLQYANLSSAQLTGASLFGANLRKASLIYAKMWSTVLATAQLEGADLSSAQLYYANLVGAKLESANFSGADLTGASLLGAQMQGANLGAAQLRNANLGYAKLQGSDLRNIFIDEKTNFSHSEIDGQTQIGIWLNSEDNIEKLSIKTAKLNQAQTDILLSQMRNQGWSK